MNEWPNTLYRYNAETGAREGKTFQSPADVPSGEGWVSFDDLGPAPVVRPKFEQGSGDGAGMPKLYRELQDENRRLLDTVKLLTDELAALKAKTEAPAEAQALEAAPEAPPPAVDTAKRKRKG